MQSLGVTIGWDLRPTHLYRGSDGQEYVIWGERKMWPERYDATGWPVDQGGRRLSVYVRQPKPQVSILSRLLKAFGL